MTYVVKPIRNTLLVISFALACIRLSAQLNVTDGNTAPYNPTNLVRNVFLGTGVEVTDVSYQGDRRSVGIFTGAQDQVGLDRGIVLSTGFVESLDEVNDVLDNNGGVIPGQSPQEQDLLDIAGSVIDDVALYTIKFIPSADTLRFRYVFASEEYPGFICDINDVFGFFITGPNPDGGLYNSTNIALIPDPADPSGATFTNIPVSINTIHNGDDACPPEFPEYYNEVTLGDPFFSLNAYLDVFNAEAIVVPCEEYTIRLGVADAQDDILNTAVFLEAKSFGTGTLEVSLNSLSVDGSLAEGCGSGNLEFELPQTVSEDFVLDLELLSPSNSATPDVDYPAFPNQLIIPAGSSKLNLPLEAFLDNEVEGNEVIQFALQVDVCNRDTFTIVLRDDDLFAPLLPEDTLICSGENLTISSELDPDFNLPPDPFFSATGLKSITPVDGVLSSTISVSGVIPTILQAGVIERICIRGVEHRSLNDFDIFVVSPGGQILELTTDNGFKPNNFADVDSFANTCFTPSATIPINNGNNITGPIFDDNPRYIGEFLPEGIWSDLWDGQNPTNGFWELVIIDDEGEFDGTIEEWSIEFKSFYDLDYQWTASPAGGDFCNSCPEIDVSPNVSTLYNLKIVDSYGCERGADINVEVEPSLDAPVINCGQVSENSIEVLWSEISGSLGYEIKIDDDPWTTVGGDNFTFTSLPSSTDYEISIRALGPNCDSPEKSVFCRTLDCTPPSIFAVVEEAVSCPGVNDGEATITATGQAPFSYEVNGQTNTNGFFDNLKRGDNDFIVTDATGCVAIGTINMPGPPDFVVSAGFQLSDPCNTVSNIAGSVNVSGATPPYSYAWPNGSTNVTSSNLTSGNYLITITDSRGCDTIHELIIPQLERLDFEVLTSAPLCFGQNNGSAEIDLLSGSEPLIIEWEDGSSDFQNTNLAAGNYVVTVTDALGCAEPQLFTVDDGANLSIEVMVTDASCKGQLDGTATVVTTGGQNPYLYSWPTSANSSGLEQGLGAGTYLLTVTDANGCTNEKAFTVGEPDGLAFDSMRIDNLCFGQNNGQINITNVSSPNGTVNILWEDGNTDFERINLANGTYCFTLTDGTVCDFTECLTIRSPEVITVQETLGNPSCENTTDGSIEVAVRGGTAPFEYLWDGPTGSLESGSDIENLIAGRYDLTVTDANQCTQVFSFSLDPPNPITSESNVFPVSCFGESTGKILFSATGGQPPFTYDWLGPQNYTATSNNIENVPAGLYRVTYIDRVGCTNTEEFVIFQPSAALQSGLTVVDSICFGMEDGSLSVSPTGGTAPYDLRWSNGGEGLEINGLAPGQYQVTLTDDNGCEKIDEASVLALEEIVLELDQNGASCFETEDGAATIIDIRRGGQSNPLSDYSILWNTSPPQSAITATGLKGGQTYEVTATDQLGCEGSTAIEIINPDPVSAVITVREQVSCFGESDGSLEIQGVGGNGTYSYAWDRSLGAADTNFVDNLSHGDYSLTITDFKGCQGTEIFRIEEPRPLALDFRKIDVSCFTGNDGRAESLVTGGTVPYQYEWSNGQSSKAIENLFSDWYFLTVTDDNGCQIIDSLLIFRPEEPITVDIEIENVTCFDGSDGRLDLQASGGSGFYRYSLDGNSFSSTGVFPNLEAGDYTVFVSDFKGCVDTFSQVFIEEPEELVVDLGPDLIIPFGNTIKIFPVISNASGDVSYQWISANLDFLSCNNCLNPTFDGSREASFELIATDENGCQSNDFITVFLENFSPLFVPTAFTPNGDGENDVLEIFGRGIETINQFEIYNKWGERVYRIENLMIDDKFDSWDGTFKGNEAPSGVYFWNAEVEFENGFSESFKGNTTLLR